MYEKNGRVMAVRDAGLSENPIFEQLRDERLYPSLVTEDCWSNLLVDFGHYRQCRRTGNARAYVLRDHDCLLLALYRVAFPKSTVIAGWTIGRGRVQMQRG